MGHSTIHHKRNLTSFGWRPPFAGGWCWFLCVPSISPIPHYSKISMIHPLTTHFRNVKLSLSFSTESHVDSWCRWVHPPAPFTSVEPKHISDGPDSATANVFWRLIRVLWRCGLSPVYHNVVFPQGMSALGGSPLRLLCSTHRTSAHQKSLVWCLANPFRCVVSVTPTSPYTPYIFLNLTIVLPFLEMTDKKGPNT